MTCRRVVITGLGIVSPLGNSASSFYSALLNGRSAIRPIQVASDAGSLEFVGAPVTGEPWRQLANPPVATSDKASLLALVAADAAIHDAHLDLTREDLRRIGVAVGTSVGAVLSQENAYHEIIAKNKSRLSPFTLVKVMQNAPASQIALRYSLLGPALTHSVTCASSSVSMGESLRGIRHGYADVMIAGGTEALFAFVSIKAWQALQVLAPPWQRDVAATCRPFSKDRNGTVLGDGAAFVVLEEFERAKRRNATPYAELVGYGICNDTHMTQPTVECQALSMELALADAQMSPDAVDYINAHGTGTQLNDVTETRAIRKTFGSYADDLAISSTKSMHGHLVGAAGALELIISALAVKHQSIPPTAHLQHQDPQCDLDYVALRGRETKVRAALSNSFAVGGTASALLVRELS